MDEGGGGGEVESARGARGCKGGDVVPKNGARVMRDSREGVLIGES